MASESSQDPAGSSLTGEALARHPHRTFVGLALPVLISLVAEPVTGLVDTAFVARLGAVPLAALGVGAMVLSSVFWIFNFLGIGTQTEVAQAAGARRTGWAGEMTWLAMTLAAILGVIAIAAGWFTVGAAADAMGADAAMRGDAIDYMRMRLLGAPAVLITVAAFGAMRGLGDMRTPLRIAVGVNLLNIALDAVLIFGWGPAPRLEVAGAGLASSISQWLGAGWAVAAVVAHLGRPRGLPLREAGRLLRIGGDLFLRTGALTLFLLLATRAATRIGAEAGAAHQAIRQVWSLSALVLDAYAIAGQTLIAQLLGGGRSADGRKVARLVCGWSFGTGIVIAAAMLATTPLVIDALVPASAVAAFYSAWWIAAASQPISGLSFGTDGIHWGTGDFRYLRNAVIVATAAGAAALYPIDAADPGGLAWVWVITGGWVTIRAAFGMLRIWPGVGRAPLGPPADPPRSQ